MISIFKSVENMLINGIDLADRYQSSAGGYFVINDVRGRGVYPVELIQTDVPGRPGSYITGRKLEPRVLEIDITLKGDDYRNLREKIEDLISLLHSDEDLTIQFEDEPDRMYFGRLEQVDHRLEKSKIYQATLYFVCQDPYKYGPIYSQTINNPKGSDIPIVQNEGNTETYPTFTAQILKPTTFLDIISPDAYMRVGQPNIIGQIEVDGDKPVLQDEMESLSGWGAGSGVVDGIIQGSFQSDGNKFTVKDYGPAYDGWAGPALKKSLPNPLQDFRVHALIDITSSANGVGRIEIYGLDSANNIVFRMAIGDYSTKTKDVKAFWGIGPSADNIFTTYGKKTGSLNDYYGSLVIERKGQRWKVYTAKRTGPTNQDGTYVDYVTNLVSTTDDEYMAKLAQIQVHIGTHLKYTPIPTMSINHVFVYDLHDPSTDQVPYIAYPGDILQFDHKKAVIYRNGDVWMDKKDFGASFFPLGRGETELVVNPSDAAVVTVSYQPRWL